MSGGFLSTSRVEAAIAGFDGWWRGRSRREQILFAAMAALIFGVVLVYGVIMPLQAARAQAFADIRTYETYSARLRAAGRIEPAAAAQPATPRTGTPQQVVSDSAAAYGFIPKVEAVGAGVKAMIAEANYDAVINWLSDLGRTSSLRIQRVSIQRLAAPGRVSATVEFAS
ncbi:type II secretion system protein M [Sphingomonas sp.]|uniref:type II secretion system protein M n=1 Tax=Sphingomonas sp. TaxID=28214 RepID=UPI001B21F111|nr:type II secretion system protein M [Sphingomonas sp.]MBO9714891.1 type II secretion system protein M [Sphingomonas sp.]